MAGEQLEAELTPEQRRIKEQFVEEVGYWMDEYDHWLAHDKAFFEIYREFLAHTWREGVLDDKTKALILLAADATVTHHYPRGIDFHVRNALDHGATFEEVKEVFQLISCVGVHCLIETVPHIVDAFGVPEADDEAERRERARVRELFEEGRGYWDEFWDPVVAMDQDFLETYTRVSSYMCTDGALDPKTREFVWMTVDMTATHIYHPGLEAHIGNAIDHGATAEELLEVAQLLSPLGHQSFVEGMPVLVEAARERGMLPG